MIKASDRLRHDLQALDVVPAVDVDDVRQLEEELDTIAANIASTATSELGSKEFQELAELQEVIALLVFKYHLVVSPRLERFVREYDRLDDEDTRKRLLVEAIAHAL